MLRGSQLRSCRLLLGHPLARCSTPASSILLKPWFTASEWTTPTTIPGSFPQPNGSAPLASRRFYSVDMTSLDPRGPVYGLSEIFEEFLSYLTVPPARRSSLLKRLRKRQHRERVKKPQGTRMVGGFFEKLGLSEEVLEAVMGMGISAPSDGSGKTLAYMSPVIERIQREKLEKLACKGPQAEEKVAQNLSTTTFGVLTDKNLNYGVVAGVATGLASLGWYLKGTAEEVQDGCYICYKTGE